MWTREELKLRAKTSISRNYWIFVLAALVMLIFGDEGFDFNFDFDMSNGPAFSVGGIDIFGGSNDVQQSVDSFVNNLTNGLPYMLNGGLVQWLMSSIFAGLVFVLGIAGIAIKIFVCGPFEVGVNYAFTKGQFTKAQPMDILQGFNGGNYLNVVKIQFLRGLFTALWTLLFIVPGIIKAYEYRMIPYLLAENPDMDKDTAFETSKQMMMGQKMDAFVLDLSFILWYILSGITLGIVGVFYVNPYINATNAQLYLVLKRQ